MKFFKTTAYIFCSFLLTFSSQLFAQNFPKTQILDGRILASSLAIISTKKDTPQQNAFKSLCKKADKIVNEGKLYSVMHKKQTPPSGDKHDYMSTGPYWWPDPSKPNGLPYIRRDGERNPEYYDITDSDEMDKLEEDVEDLALAYYFSKDEKYANFASKLIKTWFLDKETRQNPNLNFGQGIPGINTGRGIGIIETRELNRIIDGAILLQGSKSWTSENHTELKKWFSDFLTWLTDSPIGIDEADEHNNHGTMYDVQVVSYALFIGKNDLAKKQLEETKKRIASQLKVDGSQPHELERTTSWNYTNMNLNGFLLLARLADNYKVDLWNYQTSDDKSLQKAIDWLLPYLKKEKAWDYKQIKKMPYENTIRILKIASKQYANPAYNSLAKAVDEKVYNADVNVLTFAE